MIELITGANESKELVKALWPAEWETAKHLTAGEPIRLWLNEKTGLNVPGTAAPTFNHWLPRLREMAVERGVAA